MFGLEAGLPVPYDLGGELRNAGNVQFSCNRQVQQFVVRHNAVAKAVDKGAVVPSEGADDIDAMVSQRLDNGTDLFETPCEAKADLHLATDIVSYQPDMLKKEVLLGFPTRLSLCVFATSRRRLLGLSLDKSETDPPPSPEE